MHHLSDLELGEICLEAPGAQRSVLYVCMYVCMYVYACMHTCVHVCMCSCMHVRVCTILRRIGGSTMFACMHVFMYEKHTYIRLFVYAYIHACMHAYIHTYIHTHLEYMNNHQDDRK